MLFEHTAKRYEKVLCAVIDRRKRCVLISKGLARPRLVVVLPYYPHAIKSWKHDMKLDPTNLKPLIVCETYSTAISASGIQIQHKLVQEEQCL